MCDHINKQYVNMQGQFEDLKCELPDGHPGDHEADYECLRAIEGIKDPSRKSVVKDGKDYYIVTERAYWGDMAGKTTFEVANEMSEKRRILDDFKTANPGMTDAHRAKARELGLLPASRA